jgi:hypothetical protein
MIGYTRKNKRKSGHKYAGHNRRWDQNARMAVQCNCNHVWQQFEKCFPSCGRKRS